MKPVWSCFEATRVKSCPVLLWCIISQVKPCYLRAEFGMAKQTLKCH